MTPAHAADPFPRSLSPREAEILHGLLALDDERLAPLREQAATAYVVAMCGCGCATVHLAVDRDRTPRADLCSPVVSADSINPGQNAFGLLLFLDDGWLSLLEIWWIDVPPPELPPLAAFGPPVFDCDRMA